MATRVTCPQFMAKAECPVYQCCPTLTTWQGTRIVVPTMTVRLWQTLLQWSPRWNEIELRFLWSAHISRPRAMACLVSISEKTDLVIPRLSCHWQADTIHYIRDLGPSHYKVTSYQYSIAISIINIRWLSTLYNGASYTGKDSLFNWNEALPLRQSLRLLNKHLPPPIFHLCLRSNHHPLLGN